MARVRQAMPATWSVLCSGAPAGPRPVCSGSRFIARNAVALGPAASTKLECECRRVITASLLWSPGTALLKMLTNVAFAVHVAAGTLGLLAGTVAVLVRKGDHVHRVAGAVFVLAMLAMALTADYLAVVRPGQIVNLFIGTFTIYLVVTAWLAVRRSPGTLGLADKAALVVILCLLAPFAALSFELATGIKPPFKSIVPIEGPVLIALYSFTLLIALAAIGDARMVLAGGVTGARRIARHLWRMCLGLAMAAGSAFTNGLPRLLPRSVHIPLILQFLPQFVVLATLIYWLIRVRFTGWHSSWAARRSTARTPGIAKGQEQPAGSA